MGGEDMERELEELYEAANKAADVALAVDSGSAEENRCLNALRDLKDFPVNFHILVDTQVGERLRHLTKHPRKAIQVFTTDLIEVWKKIILEETTRDKKSGNSDNKTPNSIKVGKTSQPGIVEREKSEEDFSPRPTKMAKSDTSDNNHSVTTEGGSSAQPLSVSNRPPKLTSMIKCNNEARDNVRNLVFEALSKVSDEADESIQDEVEACDPIRVAVTVESVLFEKWGRSTGAQRLNYQSIISYLKDEKNPDFRRKVLLGHIKAESILTLIPVEMYSEEMKMEIEQIKEKDLSECGADQFACGRCRQRLCTYYHLQISRADERMMTFVTCVNCNNQWKFC